MAAQNQTALQLIRQTGFLDDLSDEELAKIADISEIQQQDAGTVLFQEGTVCVSLFIVVTGSVALDMHVPRRGQIRILTVGAGEILGWSALWGSQRMTAMGTILDAATLVTIPGQRLQELCDADREIGYRVMQRMAVALSRRLLAARLQLLDLFSETQPA
ncbi:transcriptional activator FtrB [Symmachiella macrocystis]|uniref:Transcriptional activator FtrB n=2 Tax=Symmachiella macrocystis TaxID=2527985 RepID=A0A5C6B944_9PLAN|nr:transcriptional activator FtrB [Symmachiella macrocystis]